MSRLTTTLRDVLTVQILLAASCSLPLLFIDYQMFFGFWGVLLCYVLFRLFTGSAESSARAIVERDNDRFGEYDAHLVERKKVKRQAVYEGESNYRSARESALEAKREAAERQGVIAFPQAEADEKT